MKRLLYVVGVFLLLCGWAQSSINIREVVPLVANGTDETVAIQSAIDSLAAMGQNTLYFPSGVYGITQIVLPANIELQGEGRVADNNTSVFKALSSTTMIIVSAANHREISINGFKIDGNNLAPVGIYFDTVVSGRIEGNAFVNFAAGTTAIMGGGCIFTDLLNNTFSIKGRAVDFQDAFSSIASQVYYGINVGRIEGNIFSAAQGVRVGGIVTIRNNDFEFGLSAPALAALEVSENTVCAATIEDNYFEISSDTTVSPKIIRLSPGNYTVANNRMYGPGKTASGSIGIDAGDSTYVYNAAITGNKILRVETGIKWAGTRSGNPSSVIAANVISEVITPLAGPTTKNAQHSPQQFLYRHDPLMGWLFTGGVGFSVNAIVDSQTTIDLAIGNVHLFDATTPKIISAVSNNAPGRLFALMSKHDGVITLTNATFNLAAGQNTLMVSNRPLWFLTDFDGKIREIGYGSLLMGGFSGATSCGTFKNGVLLQAP